MESVSYNFWMVWCMTYEGDRRWSMVRAPESWTSDDVFERAREGTRDGGVGGDAAEIIEVEPGYETEIYTEYEDEQY